MDVVIELFRHNSMMNRRLLEACRGLSPDQLEATVPGTYGGIAATLVHIANSQMGYAGRFLGEARPEPLPERPFSGFERLAARFEDGNARLEQVAARHDAGHEVQISGDDPPGTWRMPASLLLIQAINHGTEHRSQVSTILTQLGIEPPSMDGWTYFFDGGHMTPV